MLHIDDLERLSVWRRQLRSLTRSRRLPSVDFRLDELSPAENQALSARAERYRSDCGCGVGGLVMTLAVLGLIAWYAVAGPAAWSVTTAATLLALTALGALTGKGFGLAVARWRLLRLAARTDARLRPSRVRH